VYAADSQVGRGQALGLEGLVEGELEGCVAEEGSEFRGGCDGARGVEEGCYRAGLSGFFGTGVAGVVLCATADGDVLEDEAWGGGW